MIEVQAEMRLGLGTGDLEWNFGPDAVLREERVHRLQQDGFPTRRHVRELGIKFQSAMEVECFAVQTCIARPCPRVSRALKNATAKR